MGLVLPSNVVITPDGAQKRANRSKVVHYAVMISSYFRRNAIKCNYFSEKELPVIDQMFILQGYKEGWKDGKFEEKIDFRDCLEPIRLFEVILPSAHGPGQPFYSISALIRESMAAFDF